MKIKTIAELDSVRASCQRMVNSRAMAAAAASAVPGAVVGAAADVTILLELLPKINRAFGLDPEQVDQLDEQGRQQVLALAGKFGSELISKRISAQVVSSILKRVGVRASTKAVSSYVPFIGSAIAAAIGGTMMKLLGDQHIKQCYDIVKAMLDDGPDGTHEGAPVEA